MTKRLSVATARVKRCPDSSTASPPHSQDMDGMSYLNDFAIAFVIYHHQSCMSRGKRKTKAFCPSSVPLMRPSLENLNRSFFAVRWSQDERRYNLDHSASHLAETDRDLQRLTMRRRRIWLVRGSTRQRSPSNLMINLKERVH